MPAACASSSAASTAPPIRYVDCFANTHEDGCTALPGSPLDSPMFGLATSADGASLYVASEYASVASFGRDPSGDLSYLGCFANLGDRGCAAPTLNSLRDPVGVVASADGQSVYAVSDDGSALSTFDRAPDGSLAYDGCFADEGKYGCEAPTSGALGEPAAITISPDDQSVYVVGWRKTITWFDRAADGSLTYGGCFADKARFGCEQPQQNSIGFAFGVTVSPDGNSVYVAGGGDAITIFDRQPGGTLVSAGCIADQARVPKGCQEVSHSSLNYTDTVAVSPDGGRLYSVGDDVLSVFNRDGDGNLEFAQCFRAEGREDECDPPGRVPTDFTSGLAVSPDGKWVYIGGGDGAGGILQFKVRDNGRLAYSRCVARYAGHGCRVVPTDAFVDPWTLAISPDGQSLYVSTDSYPAPAIVHFELRTDPAVAEARKQEPNAISYWDPGHAVLGTGETYRPSEGTIQLSDDGGQTFDTVLEAPDGVGWVTTAGTQDAWAVLDHRGDPESLLHSTDGGQTWDQIANSPPPAPSFGTPLEGMAVNDMWDSRLLVTHDGGATWSKTGDPCRGAENMAVAMADANNALLACGYNPAVGTEGKEMYTSSDGGQTWRRRARTSNGDGGLSGIDYIYGLSYSPSGAGIFFSYEPFLTGDGGRHWTEADAPRGGYSGQMFTPSDGVLLDGQHVIVTDDGGDTWNLVHHF